MTKMFKLFCLAVFLTCAVGAMVTCTTPARADRVDEIERYDIRDYCNVISQTFQYGIVARNEGRPLMFKQAPATDENKTDAIYVVGLETMTPKERAYTMEHISAGWQFADRFYKEARSQGFKITTVDPQLAGWYFTKCLKERTEKAQKKRTLQIP